MAIGDFFKSLFGGSPSVPTATAAPAVSQQGILGQIFQPATQGIQNLLDPNIYGQLGQMYVQGKMMDALGVNNVQSGMQNQMLRNQFANSVLGGPGGQSPTSSRRLGGQFKNIRNNADKEAIKAQFGFADESDADLMKWYSGLFNEKGEMRKLTDKDFQKLIMMETLMMPTDVVMEKKSEYNRLQDQARADVRNQFGGRFKTYDTNSMYPQYGTPSYADGGLATLTKRRVPDISFSRYAQGGLASFPDLNNDGEITQADILKGRGVDLRYGGEASGPGTGTSDSIPARLSDGEFVMTADAVKGMGKGDRAEGVRKMYAIMNELERLA